MSPRRLNHAFGHPTSGGFFTWQKPYDWSRVAQQFLPNFDRGDQQTHGPTYIPGSACRFAFFPAHRERGRSEETSEDPDEERVGTRRSDQGRVSFFARTGPCGSRTRCPDLPVGRSRLADAKGYRERDSAGGLAASERNARKAGRQTCSDFCLRSLLPGPWGLGNRFNSVGSEIWQPCCLRIAGRMVGPNHRGVSPARTVYRPSADAKFRVERSNEIFPREVVNDQRDWRQKRENVPGKRRNLKIQNAGNRHSQRR